VSLDRTPLVKYAVADRDVAQRVARHKSIFFRERDGRGDIVEHDGAVRGGLQLVPDGEAEKALASDYAGMLSDGLLFETAPDFTTLVARCRDIQDRANEASKSLDA
jgi:hypothetical protein